MSKLKETLKETLQSKESMVDDSDFNVDEFISDHRKLSQELIDSIDSIKDAIREYAEAVGMNLDQDVDDYDDSQLCVIASDNEIVAARNDVLAELLKDGVISKLPDELNNETRSCAEIASQLRMEAKSSDISVIKDLVRKKYSQTKEVQNQSSEKPMFTSKKNEPLITHFEFSNKTPIDPIILVDEPITETTPIIEKTEQAAEKPKDTDSNSTNSDYGNLIFEEGIPDHAKNLLKATFTALIAIPDARCHELKFALSEKYPGLIDATYISTDGVSISRVVDPGVLISEGLVTIQVPVAGDSMMLPVPGQWNHVLNAFLYTDFELDPHEAAHIASHFMFGDQSLYGYFDMSKYNTRNLPESKFRNLELKLHRIMDFIPTVADSGKMLPRWRFAKVSHGGDNFTLVSDKGVISPFASTGETSPTILKGATIIVDGDSIILKYKGKDYKVPVFESIEDAG